MQDLVELELMILELDERLRPIAKTPVDLNDPDWMNKLRAVHPLDRIGKRSEAETLLAKAVDAYSTGDSATREAIRTMFGKYSSFAWAAAPPWPLSTKDGFTRHLLLFSILDQGRDARDAITWLREMVATAKAAKLDVSAACWHVANLSSDVDRYGLGSTRSMLLEC